MSLPADALAESNRTDIVAFYDDVFGWKEIPQLTEDRKRLVLMAYRYDQFVFLIADEPHMTAPRLDHFGMGVDTMDELDEFLRRATTFKERDDRVDIIDKKAEDHGVLVITSFYVRYLLPLMVEVQHYEMKDGAKGWATMSSQIALEDPFEHFDNSIAGDVRDPYPELADLRETTPVLKVGGDGEAPPMFVVSRYDDVARVLLDGETFSSSMLAEVMGPAMGEHIILGMDEPEHRRHRALVGTAFRQKMLARWESELVRRVVDELIDTFVDAGPGGVGPAVHVPVPRAGHRRRARPAARGLPPVPGLGERDHQRELGLGARHRCLRRAQGVSRGSARGASCPPTRRPGQRSRGGRARR